MTNGSSRPKHGPLVGVGAEGVNGGARGASVSSPHAVTKVGQLGSHTADDTPSASKGDCGRTDVAVNTTPHPPVTHKHIADTNTGN